MKAIVLGAAAAVAMITAQVATAAPDTTRAGDASISEVDLAAARALSATLCDQVKAMPASAPADLFEAQIVYALSQSTLSVTAKRSALTQLRNSCTLTAPALAGLNNATNALGRGATDGTAGLATINGINASGGNGGSSAFSNPTLDVGGGSVNYATTGVR